MFVEIIKEGDDQYLKCIKEFKIKYMEEKFCNCINPCPSLFPDGRYYCLCCWGEYYR